MPGFTFDNKVSLGHVITVASLLATLAVAWQAMSSRVDAVEASDRRQDTRLEAYADPGYGWDVATIGYGHTSKAGPPQVMRGLRISAAEADSILRRDLATVEAVVRTLVKVPLSDNQFGALVSFVFNVGATAFAKSTLLRLLNKGDYAGAAGQFKRWNKSNGKVLKGLTRRRAAEAELFASASPVQPKDDLPGTPIPDEPTLPRTESPMGRIVGLIIAALVSLGMIIAAWLNWGGGNSP